MAKQLLIYEKATPISNTKHRNLSVKTGNDYKFAKNITYVPLNVAEFPAASLDYAIVFSGNDDNLMPIAAMGVKEGENLYVSEDGKMDVKYIPLFLKRYPFVFTSADSNGRAHLCIDESFAGCNEDGVGERLFDSEGEQTVYLKNVLGFLQKYQQQVAQTRTLCKKLQELDLLEPMGARIKPAQGEEIAVSFKAISRKKLKELSDKDLQMLMKSDILEFMYIHLHSLRNFGKIAKNATDVTAQSKPADASEEAAVPEANDEAKVVEEVK